MLTEKIKKQVKDKIKAKVKKYWGKNLEEILPAKEKRLELYENAWKMREKNNDFSAIPNAIILQLLIETIGHWDKKGRGAKLPKDDNQGYHTISAR